MKPFTRSEAEAWWRTLAQGRAVGTAQLRLAQLPNALDTIAGSDAERLYKRLGWINVAFLPRYAAFPDGTLAPTTIFYKELAD